MSMSRRPINRSRRISEAGASPISTFIHSRSRAAPSVSTVLILLGAFLFIGCLYRGRGDFSCPAEVQRAIPILKKAYGDSMHKVLHVGPDTYCIVSKLLKEEHTEAWGVEPYDIEETDRTCKRLVNKGIARVADIKFLLPYKTKSFSIVIVSDALDYLSPKYMNRTLPELARVSSDGLVIFTAYPRHHKVRVSDRAQYGRSASHIYLIIFIFFLTSIRNTSFRVKFESFCFCDRLS